MVDVVAARMRSHRLTGAPLPSAVDAVRHFGAVQAQDYPAAKWAIGLRVRGGVEERIDGVYDDGAILRTHVLRPTWHFVRPEDIRWMLALSGPKILQGVASRHRELGLDPATVVRAHRVFEKVLAGGKHMTRLELGEELRAAGIPPDGQRLPHLLMSAELSSLLTSGRRKGVQHSYALLEERVAKASVLDRDEAVAELTRRYFVAHGPAQVRDLVWWSGLNQLEARRGIAAAGPALRQVEVDGASYWLDASLGAGRPAVAAHLLPNFDEYTVGYTDRAAILHPGRPFRPELFAFSSLLANVVIVDGQVCGAWRKEAGRESLRIEIRPLATLTAGERRLIELAGGRLSGFLGRRVDLAWL